MANHRIATPSPGRLQLLTPTYLRRLNRNRKIGMAVDFIVLGVLFPTVIQLFTGHWGVTAGLILGTLVRMVVMAVLEGQDQADDDRREERDRDMMESLAANPGGAPLMADVRSHCGCILRYAYDREHVLWTPVGVIESADSCLAEAR